MFKLVKELSEVENFLAAADIVGLDIETTDLHPKYGKIRLVQLSNSNNEIILVDCFNFSIAELDKVFTRLFDPTLKLVIQNALFEYKWFKYHFGKNLNSYFDTYLAAKLIDFQAKAGLGFLIDQYLGVNIDKSEQVSNWAGELTKSQLDYAATDVLYLLPLREKLMEKLKQLKLIEAARLEFNCVPAVAGMELAGIPVNLDRFNEFILTAEAKRDEYLAKLNHFLLSAGGKNSYNRTYVVDLFGDEVDIPNESSVNLRSQQQLLEKFKDAGIDIDTTDKKMIAILVQEYPELQLLLDFREQEKLCSTYGREFIKKHVREDSRIYGSFLQMGAVTGRFASRSPNNQNQPSTKEFRRIFQPKPGRRFIVSDMAQFELRILGSFSNDTIMLNAFNEGRDLHSVTTEQIFGIPYAECKLPENKHKRTISKICNFSIAYGIGGDGLCIRLRGEGIDIDPDGAKKFIEDWYAAYPQAGAWLKKQRYLLGNIKRNLNLKDGAKGFIDLRGVDGRLIRPSFIVGDMSSEGGAKRDCQNFPIQSCVAAQSKVYTTEGIYKIEDLRDRDDVTIWNGENFVKCSKIVYSGKKQLVRIKLQGGYVLQASKDHKFWCCGTDGKYKWLTVEQISKLKHIWIKMTSSMDFDSINTDNYTDMSFINDSRKPIHLAMIENNFDMGVFLGRIASDGYVGHGCVSLTVAEHELEVLQEMQRIAAIFGYTGIDKSVRGIYNPIYKLNISSRALAEELLSLKIKKDIPTFVLNNKDILRGYLRGLFDGDGTVNSDNIVNTWGGNVSEKVEWARNVQHALLQFGIRGRIRIYEREKNSSIRLAIMKADCDKFAREIGFINSRKQSKALLINNTHHPKISTIYGFASKVKSVEFTDEMVDMYDVLDSDNSTFCVDGFVSHNCNAVAIKRALTNLHKILEEKYPTASVVNCVHDEIVVECDESDADLICSLVKECMEEGGTFYMKNVKIEADAKVCLDWSEK